VRDLKVTDVSASHPGAKVLHDIDLTVADGTTTAVLGPSGCGKTTLLRVIAGFMRPDSGEVRIGDDVMVGPGTWVPPEKRGFGYVAQEGNLFPHLDIAANVLYGLPRRERKDQQRVGELLELVGLPADLGARRPDQLSGGQQQRVALARALARRPQLVLLDEPFSALDPELRASTRDAVAAALRHERATVVLVTHDQAEALSFADQVAIMHAGRLMQVGPPSRVYREPTGRRSATSLGEASFLPGRLADGVVTCALGALPVPRASGAGACDVVVRPEQLRLGVASPSAQLAKVQRTEYFGHDALVQLELLGAEPVTLQARVDGDRTPAVGDTVAVHVVGEPHVMLSEP
jgi:iron(III) transport system ATP-binding protein